MTRPHLARALLLALLLAAAIVIGGALAAAIWPAAPIGGVR